MAELDITPPLTNKQRETLALWAEEAATHLIDNPPFFQAQEHYHGKPAAGYDVHVVFCSGDSVGYGLVDVYGNGGIRFSDVDFDPDGDFFG